MGNSGKRYFPTCSRKALVVAGLATPVAMAGTWALGPGDSGRAAAPAADPAAAAPADPARSLAPRSDRARRPAPARQAMVSERKKKKAKAAYKVVRSGSCKASYYWDPQPTASGEQFDPDELTAAHRTLPMNSRVRVTNRNNGDSVVVRINDRGPYIGGRCLDLSRAAMASVGGTSSGVIPVKYQVLARR